MPHYYSHQSEMEIGVLPIYSFFIVKNESEFKHHSDTLSFSERLKEEINILHELAGITTTCEHDISQLLGHQSKQH